MPFCLFFFIVSTINSKCTIEIVKRALKASGGVYDNILKVWNTYIWGETKKG